MNLGLCIQKGSLQVIDVPNMFILICDATPIHGDEWVWLGWIVAAVGNPISAAHQIKQQAALFLKVQESQGDLYTSVGCSGAACCNNQR